MTPVAGQYLDADLRGQVSGYPVWPAISPIEYRGDAPILDAAVAWLHAHLRWFDPNIWERTLPPRPFREGAALELLMLCRILRRGRFHDHPLIADAVELAHSLAATDSFHAALGLGDDKFPYRAYLVALLADLGRPVPGAAERVRTVLATGCGGQHGAWRTPLSRLELHYVLELGQFPNPLPPSADLLELSIIAAAPDPLYLRDDEVYALTHVLFYATDFAARPTPVEPELVEALRTLLGTYLALGDMDLAGELLLCLLAIGPPDCALTTHGWHTLARHRLSDGAVPGPLFDPARWSTLRDEVAEGYAFGTCHHTTMVAAMAAAERERHRAR
ncbi:DUF6895 family protein [Nocardia brasiliensis]|uniref:DUF6895 family protein n=1 Tax=Nocardia brasiliensis TaxID=37326 RepID=UPI002458C126|nr:hypothetical protein [Nocardia brasiliensis]